MDWTEVLEIDQNGIITQYEVMYDPLMTFGVLTTLTVTTTSLSITLMGLEEYVEYNISVRAYTSVGPGPYSVGIVRRTFEDGKLLGILEGQQSIWLNLTKNCVLQLDSSLYLLFIGAPREHFPSCILVATT